MQSRMIRRSVARVTAALGAAILLSGAASLGTAGAAQQTVHRWSFPILSSWPVGVQNFIRDEESPVMASLLYRNTQVKAGAGGCYDTNCGASRSAWKVEWQRMGFRNVIGGVLSGSQSTVRTGLKIFDYAFQGEAANGSFPGSAGPFHGTAMFLAEAAPALIFLKYSPMGPVFAKTVAGDAKSIDSAATYVYKHGQHIEKIDGRAGDRWYEAALAFESAGILSGNTQLTKWAEKFARGANFRMSAAGVMEEWGGHDTYYQGLGLVDAVRYMLMIGSSDPLYTPTEKAISRGMRWEAGRISSDGTINATGDKRSYDKPPFPYSVAGAFAHWAGFTGSATYAALAHKVWHKYYA